MLPASTLLRAIMLATLLGLLPACAPTTHSTGNSDAEPAPDTAASSPAPAPNLPATEQQTPPAEVDFSCKADTDCAVKNVGNCCGYYPACVNAGSPTFPEQVMAQCQREGLSSICGFREISACQCVEGRCAPAQADAQLD